MTTPKIFGIGLQKTATKSLASALLRLGYSVTGPNFNQDSDLEETLLDKAIAIVPQYDAFQDEPWPILYREMDARFPGSRFILTLRDEDDWFASALSYFGDRENPMRRLIYGCGAPAGNEALYRERFRRHNAEVIDYFSDRPKDFLIMDITRGDGWDKLCPFLGRRRPFLKPFPFKNPGAGRDRPKGFARLRSRFTA